MDRTRTFYLSGNLKQITESVRHHLEIVRMEERDFSFKGPFFLLGILNISKQKNFELHWDSTHFSDFGELYIKPLNDNHVRIIIAEPYWTVDHIRGAFRSTLNNEEIKHLHRWDKYEHHLELFVGYREDFFQEKEKIINKILEGLSIDGYLIQDAVEKRKNLSEYEKYVNENRISELTSSTTEWDTSRLVQLCKELNTCSTSESYLATSMVLRTILNHIPPIFNYKTFSELANNYGGEKQNKSFKKSMQNLDKILKNIADRHLHQPIRKQEGLPSRTQVDFRQDLDVLLEEIVRVLKE